MSLTGCSDKETKSAGEVTIYFSVDEPYVTPLLKRFEKQTGIKVRAVTDTEATKSAGLAEKLEAEKDHPIADVYWGNEIFRTINLAQRGVFAPYRPRAADDVPAQYRSGEDLFTPVGLRHRTIVVSRQPDVWQQSVRVQGIEDLVHPSLRGKIAMCHPAFGTTSGHIATLYVTLGEARFKSLMTALRRNDIKLLGGNSAVVQQVAAASLIAGLTDNDDISNAGPAAPVAEVVPDQQDKASGTLMIPSTIALVNNAPHGENARRLIDFLTDPAIERELIAAKFFSSSVRDSSKIRAMQVDYMKCAAEMQRAIELALEILQDRPPQSSAAEKASNP